METTGVNDGQMDKKIAWATIDNMIDTDDSMEILSS
jgi:hypothetical protein